MILQSLIIVTVYLTCKTATSNNNELISDNFPTPIADNVPLNILINLGAKPGYCRVSGSGIYSYGCSFTVNDTILITGAYLHGGTWS